MSRPRLQFRRTLRNFVLVFLFVLISERQQSLFANIDKLATVIGLASDLYSGHMALDGKTTLSPAMAVHSWRNDYYGYYANIKFGHYGRLTRSIVGDYKYELRTLKPDGTFSVSNETFPILFFRRRDYRCDLSTMAAEGVPAQKHIFNELEDFVVAFYHASPPVKTGLKPPGAPYKFIARTDADIISKNCNPVDPSSIEVDCNVILLKDWGTVYERFPLVDVQYDWPPSVWGERAFVYADGSIK